jgi:hypothetical protein
MVITQADSRATQQSIRANALNNNVRVAYESERDDWNLCQLHPADMKAAFFEIESDAHNDFNGHWHPVGGTGWEDQVKQDVTVDYLGVELQSSDPVTLAELWGNVAGLPVQRDGAELSMTLNNATVRFVEAEDGRGAGLGGIDLAVTDRQHVLSAARDRGCYIDDNQVNICGTRWYLHDV